MRGRSVRLSFTLPESYGGLAKAEGIAEVDESGIFLEFEVEDGFFGVLRSGVKEARLEVAQIRSAEVTEGWFRTQLVIEATTLSATGDIPGSKQGRVELAIPRKQRAAARQAESLLAAGLAREELEGLRRDLGRGYD